MTQKTPTKLSRADVEARLAEIDQLMSIDTEKLSNEQFAKTMIEQSRARKEAEELSVILAEFDRRDAVAAEAERTQSIEAEIAALDAEVKQFEASLPGIHAEIREAAKSYAAQLSKLVAAGRKANSQKSRAFELRLQLEGRSIRLSDTIPVAIHLPQAPMLLALNYNPRDEMAVYCGSAWNVGRVPIDKILQDSAIG